MLLPNTSIAACRKPVIGVIRDPAPTWLSG
jgi:hypothetical protein